MISLDIVTPDGATLLYGRGGRVALHWLTGPPRADTVLDIPSAGARLSPDGRWIAYRANGIFVQPFPGPGPRVQVSAPGTIATQPVWSRDGQRLYYDEDSRMTVATVRTSPAFSILSRRALFDVHGYTVSPGIASYDAAPDGEHLLMIRNLNNGELALVHNWGAWLRARTGTAR
jgi:hypothetical protein